MMTPQDHIREAENCLEVSAYLDRRGMRLLASDLIWLAAKYSVNGVDCQCHIPRRQLLINGKPLRAIRVKPVDDRMHLDALHPVFPQVADFPRLVIQPGMHGPERR